MAHSLVSKYSKGFGSRSNSTFCPEKQTTFVKLGRSKKKCTNLTLKRSRCLKKKYAKKLKKLQTERSKTNVYERLFRNLPVGGNEKSDRSSKRISSICSKQKTQQKKRLLRKREIRSLVERLTGSNKMSNSTLYNNKMPNRQASKAVWNTRVCSNQTSPSGKPRHSMKLRGGSFGQRFIMDDQKIKLRKETVDFLVKDKISRKKIFTLTKTEASSLAEVRAHSVDSHFF